MGLVVGAIYIHPALLEQRFEDTEILAQMAERGGEREPHGLYSGTMAGADAQAEAPWGELSNDLCLLHHHQGMAWKSRHDRGSQLDVLRTECGGGEDGDAIKACSAGGHPDGMETQLLCLLNVREHLTCLVPTDGDANQPGRHILPSLPRSHTHAYARVRIT